MHRVFTNIMLPRRMSKTIVPGKLREYIIENVQCRVDIEIDTEALFREMGAAALGNKSKTSIGLGGRVKATVKVLK